jgi:hypothetical protein
MPALLLLFVILPPFDQLIAQSASPFRLRHDRDREQLVFDVGPVDLEAGTSHEGHGQPPVLVGAFPAGGWVHGFDVDLVDRAGRALPRELLHHINLIVPQKRELFSGIMLRVGAAGPETDPVKLPRLLGYRVARGDSLLVTTMLHNPTGTAHRGVRVRVRLPFTANDDWPSPISIFPFYVDVMPPAGIHAYDLPPGRSVKSWQGSPAVAGRILGVGGHLHEYGVELRFEDLTAGKVLWSATPKLDENGKVAGIPTKKFFWQLGLKIHPDHVYRLSAIYENPTGTTIPNGAMGTLGGVFLPDDSKRWPAIDRTVADYLTDVRVTYRLDAGDERAADGAPSAAHSHH